MDNYQDVLHQMREFGVEFRDKDLPLKINTPKSKGCGQKGKYWYKLRAIRPKSGVELIVGSFGKYGSDQRIRVEVDFQPMDEAERQKLKADHDAARAAAEATRQAEAQLAALSATEHWHRAHRAGESAYLTKKGVIGESCRWLHAPLVMRWPGRQPGEQDTVVKLPTGTLLVPLLRYDYDAADALRAIQFIRPDGAKLFTRGFAKQGCAVRLGKVLDGYIVLVCEGYATGLTLRMATDRELPVYVALDAGNLYHVVALVRQLHPDSRILICADDDWQTRDQFTKLLNNPGRTAAKTAAKATTNTDIVYPIFNAAKRGKKDTDFNDLHALDGLGAVTRQIRAVVNAMRSRYG